VLYGHFRSISFAFQHSLRALFPYTPHRSVAETVVKKLPAFCRKWFPGWGGEHFYIPAYLFVGESAEQGK